MNRNDINFIRAHYASLGREGNPVALVAHWDMLVATCDLALQALDRDGDAKLGKAVREALTGERHNDATHLDWIANALQRDGYIIPLNVIRAIASHLREESKS